MLPPHVIIPSTGVASRMHAHKILVENRYPNWHMVVDDQEQALRAVDAGVPQHRVYQCHRPAGLEQDGIAWVRQWSEEQFPRDKWYVSLDDNVRGWTWLPEPFYSMDGVNLDMTPEQVANTELNATLNTAAGVSWRQLFETPCPFDQVVKIWQQTIADCEARGTWAGGYAVETNFFFRSRKWQTLGYVRAQNAVWKNVGLPFYYWKGAMLEDFVRSVDVVARTGGVLINRFLKPQKTFFEPGGIGSFDERRPNLVECCKNVMLRWPGLTRFNKGQDYSLTFALRTRASVDAWRRKHGYL